MNPLIQARQEIRKNSTLEKNLKVEMLRLINYIEKHPHVKYFPLDKIKEITRSERNESILNIAIYLCGERIKLLEPRYSYFVDNDKEIELTRNEFKYYLVHRDEALSKFDEIIFPVIKERLVMYFTTNLTSYNYMDDYDEWDIE